LSRHSHPPSPKRRGVSESLLRPNVLQEMIEKALPESKVQLEKVSAEVATALDKIKTREDRWNNQLEHMTREYRTLRETLSQVCG
jgi:hypothetical protein